MTRILYYSVHEALEYDDILLFQSLGYSVFPLGAYFPIEEKPNPFRPKIAFGNDVSVLSDIFKKTSCQFTYKNVAETNLKKEFIDHFDMIIVMHDVHFIAKNWDIIKHKKVIWRTIGQAIDSYDPMIAPYRNEGLRIVRWSPREVLINGYVGHDAIIRSYKNPATYQEWRGFMSKYFLTFSSAYKMRYPEEYIFFDETVQDYKYKIGGGSNTELAGSIGLVEFDKQIDLLRESFCYLYFHGTEIPYTLNFIEAWMVGMPMIVINRDAQIGRINTLYNEVNDFVIDGVNGFKVKTPQQARSLMKSLLKQRDRAAEIGRQGRLSAISLFGMFRAQNEWNNLFQALLR